MSTILKKYRYPIWLKKANEWLSIGGGVVCVVIGLLLVLSCVMRYIVGKPAAWTTVYSCYLQCLALFMGCSNAYQNKSHVGVDILRSWILKKGIKMGKGIVRVLSIVGYLQTLFFLGVMLWACFEMAKTAVKYHMMVANTYPIPQYILYAIIIFGILMMLLAVFCIILTLLTDDETYLIS